MEVASPEMTFCQGEVYQHFPELEGARHTPTDAVSGGMETECTCLNINNLCSNRYMKVNLDRRQASSTATTEGSRDKLIHSNRSDLKKYSRSCDIHRSTSSRYSPPFIDTRLIPSPMNLSIDAAQEALKNPSSELKDILNDPRVPAEAMDAMKAEGFKPESKGNRKREGTSDLGDGRLQVVNEKQEFR